MEPDFLILVKMKRTEAGIGLVEVMVSTVMLMLIGASMVSNLHFSLRSSKFIEVQHAASTIAADQIEKIASLDALSITAKLDEREAIVYAQGLNLPFKRSTTVVVNPDSSRSVTVSVYTSGNNMPKPVVFKNNFYAW